MKLSNNLTASEYLIYNPYLVGEEVSIILRNDIVYDGIVTLLSYNINIKTITSEIEIDIPSNNILGLEEYIKVTYDLVAKCYYFKVEENIITLNSFKSNDIISVIPKKCGNKYKIRNIFQNLFECNYICKFKDTDLCDKCYSFEGFKYVDNNKIFLLGDRVKVNNKKATILSITIRDGGIYYRYLEDGVNYYSGLSALSFIENSNNSISLYYRAGYLKKDNEYYCNKCIFQDCNKCLISKL